MDESYGIARDQSEGHKALLELEKIFNKKPRSGALGIQGSQIQALTSFIHFFERYPYPVIINAAILKLADWFRTYNNTVKYYVYKVFKQASDLHLAKLINVEETVRRILPILGSNDTIARSITLRVLGCMSMIIAEKLDVQYGIIQQLELATDRIELEAAIWAGDQICSRSSRFPAVIFSKVVDKLENPSTPFDIKLRLVKIFRHMHQDIGMARQAKLTCLVLLQDPTTNPQLIIVTLRTLTLLLSQAIIDRKEQIDRLLDYALNDTREEICYNVLNDLVLLGKNDIMFDESHILQLLQLITRSDKRARIQHKAFLCAQTLIETHQKLIVNIICSSLDSPILIDFKKYMEMCEHIMMKAIQDRHYTMTIASARFLYSMLRIIMTQHGSANSMDVDIPVLPEMKSLGTRVTESITQVDLGLIKQDQHTKKLRELLKIKANFCLLLDDWDCDATFKNAFELLTSTEDDTATVLLPYLSSISTKCQQLTSWFPAVALVELKKRMSKAPIYVNLMRLLLRTTEYDSQLSLQLIDLIYEFGQWDNGQFQENGWNLYLIGMEAGSCGWFHLMHIIMNGLCKKVETEASYYWLNSLSLLAYAEWQLSINQLSTDHFIKSLIELKTLQSFDHVRTLQYWFIQLRMELVQIIQLALEILGSNRTQRIHQCAVRFRKIAFRYDFIAQSHFGCDKEMMGVIESYKICALVCEHACRSLVQQMFCIDPSLIALVDKTSPMVDLCKEFLNKINQWEEVDGADRIQLCSQDIKSIFETILQKPLILPRSFFKSKKNMSIQLTTEPILNEAKPITLLPNEDLVIKFEGLLEMNQQIKKLESKIKKAIIVCFVTKSKMLNFDDRLGVHMLFSEPTQTLINQSELLQPPTVYLANVRNSYFTYTGLLSLPKSDLQPLSKKEAWVNVFVKILDENSGIWSIGPIQWGKVIWQ